MTGRRRRNVRREKGESKGVLGLFGGSRVKENPSAILNRDQKILQLQMKLNEVLQKRNQYELQFREIDLDKAIQREELVKQARELEDQAFEIEEELTELKRE